MTPGRVGVVIRNAQGFTVGIVVSLDLVVVTHIFASCFVLIKLTVCSVHFCA